MRSFFVLIGTVLVSASLLAARAVDVGPQSFPQERGTAQDGPPSGVVPGHDVHLARAMVDAGSRPSH